MLTFLYRNAPICLVYYIYIKPIKKRFNFEKEDHKLSK